MIDNKQGIQTFQDFWPYYVQEHRQPATRQLHFLGTTFAIANLVKFAIYHRPSFLLKAAVSGYFWAWTSHMLIEKNKPATFKYPLQSLGADFLMYYLMLSGKMDEEVQKYSGVPFTPES